MQIKAAIGLLVKHVAKPLDVLLYSPGSPSCCTNEAQGRGWNQRGVSDRQSSSTSIQSTSCPINTFTPQVNQTEVSIIGKQAETGGADGHQSSAIESSRRTPCYPAACFN